jgi:hypothetical protein
MCSGFCCAATMPLTASWLKQRPLYCKSSAQHLSQVVAKVVVRMSNIGGGLLAKQLKES